MGFIVFIYRIVIISVQTLIARKVCNNHLNLQFAFHPNGNFECIINQPNLAYVETLIIHQNQY